MHERISKLFGDGVEPRLILGTFHSVCRRYLVTYGHLIGIRRNFGIADASDTLSIVRRVIKRYGLNIDPRKVQARISHSKSKGIGHVELAQEQIKKRNVEQQDFLTVFEGYEDQLARSNLLDYDDLLVRCVDLLGHHPSCVSNVEAVLIDEFQDTNVVQFELMRLFAAKKKRITTVGDPDQSIYGWRSAEVKNLKKMQIQYPDTLTLHLEENYRSSGAILVSAREVIEQDELRPQTPLLPTHCPGTIPVLRRLPTAEIEATWIVTEIQRTIALTGNLLNHSDFAILLRSASVSRLLETAMGKAGIPYRMVGGRRFYDRVEIKTLLDYLRLINQPNNTDALCRIINVPPRGIGPETVKKLLEEAEAKHTTLWQLIRDVIQGHHKTLTKIAKSAEHGIGSLTNIILTARNRILDPIKLSSPEDLLKFIMKRLDFEAYMRKTHSADYEARWANVKELVAQSAEYSIATSNDEEGDGAYRDDDALPTIDGLVQEKHNPAEEALSRFLANVALATELQREGEEDAEGVSPRTQVTISTMHAAKGLEWPVVFVPSAYDGCIPHSRAEDTDEERRLLYVAMTRAQALLYLSCPTKNTQREDATISPFLSNKMVQRLLTSKGPNIGTAEIVDIARILRRKCPSKTEICKTSARLQHRADDLWPFNDEESVEAIIQERWSKWDQHDELGGHISKRRRLAKDIRNGPGEMRTSESVGVITTMQSASTFSYNSTEDFTTAAQMHQTSKQERYVEYEDEQSKKDRPCKARHDQGNLLSLWDMKSGPAKSKPYTGSTSARITSVKSARQSLKATKDVDFATSVRYDARVPLSSIPQPLAAHRPACTGGNSRPYRVPVDENTASRQHVFLSSSPPPPKELDEIDGEAELPSADHSFIGDNIGERPQSLDHQPVKTFHTTTIAQVQEKSSNVKKTLGVRRSMNGWPGGGRQRFSVPRMANAQQ
ncbi:MAG: hypothetical protein Q9217_001192 [Psora testacea]